MMYADVEADPPLKRHCSSTARSLRRSDFDIAKMVVIHGATAIVADDDVAKLRAHLKAKYAL
jgi:hypothetical protein